MKSKGKIQVKNRILAFALALTIMIPFSFLLVDAKMNESQFKQSMAQKGFPASYHEKLWYMYNKYPNWEFEPILTGVDWNDAVANESLSGKCTVPISSTARLYKSHSWGTYNSNGSYTYKIIDGNQSNQTGHINTTPQCVAFYMDPRNFIDDTKSIFQFEDISFDNGIDVNAVQDVVNGTFMAGNITYKDTSGNLQNANKTYAQAIFDAGRDNDVNPVYLAGKILQEVGNNGSNSTSGSVAGYVGYYNFFNIGANNSNSGQAVINGLKRAKNEKWNTPEKSIRGGAHFLAVGYVACGQNTAYLTKFNVNPTNKSKLYYHQYMSAINDPSQSASSTYAGYEKKGKLASRHVFAIPVFNNMPDATATKITINNINHSAKMNATHVNVRDSAGVDNENNPTTGRKLNKGQDLEILGGYRTKNMFPIYKHQLYYPLWYEVRFTGTDNKTHKGFVFEDFVDIKASIGVRKGSTLKINCSLYPFSSKEKPMYSSYDTRIATVDSNGNIEGVNNGTTKVVAYVSSGAFDVVNVTVSNEGTTPTPTPNKITSQSYSVTNGFVKGVNSKTTLSAFKNNINEKNYIKVFNSKGNEITNGNTKMATGWVVKLYKNNSVVDTATVAVKGDTNGDSVVDISDLMQVQSHILGVKMLSGVRFQAGNYSMDSGNIIDILDLMKIQKNILGM